MTSLAIRVAAVSLGTWLVLPREGEALATWQVT